MAENRGSLEFRSADGAAAGSLALFQSFSSEVSSDNVSYVEVKAESFFEDRLLNLRHFEREHCSRHSALPCSSEICTHALKVGRFSISMLTKLTRPGASTQSDKLETVELEGKAYTRDSLSATDLIVGYRMASTLCGELIAWGENRSPSSKLMQVEVDGIRRIETYQEHFFRFQKEMEGRNQGPHPRVPSSQGAPSDSSSSAGPSNSGLRSSCGPSHFRPANSLDRGQPNPPTPALPEKAS